MARELDGTSPPPSLREQRRAELRQRLSDTATALFLERGFDAVKVVDIARACGVTEKTVFNHFPSKESLLVDRWEAIMTAGHRRLSHLTLIVDRNRLQQGAGTEETNGLDPLDDKLRAFGWDVAEVDGHDPAALLAVLGAPVEGRTRPLGVIANTVKGKGVSFMENQARWHHGVPDAAQFEQAMRELA